MSMRPARRAGGEVLRGIVELALLRPGGMERFSGTREGFLASLAALFLFLLAGDVLQAPWGGTALTVLSLLLRGVVGLLAPPVLSEAMARAWGRQALWLRYATAFNWTRWAMIAVAMAVQWGIGLFIGAGMQPRQAVLLGLAAIGIYGAVLDWFVARTGLRLYGWQAVVLVLVVDIGSGLLILLPGILSGTPMGLGA